MGIAMIDHAQPSDRIPRRRVNWRTVGLSGVLAAAFWGAWGAAEYVVQLHYELAEARIKAAEVYIPYRNKWLCVESRTRPGYYLCLEPKGQS